MRAYEARELLARTSSRQPENVVFQEGRDYLHACDGALRAEEAIAKWQSLPRWKRLWEWMRP